MKRHNEIATVARELYEQSGRMEGKDDENWHEAEKIVSARYMADEKTPDQNDKVKVAAKKIVKKAEPAATGETKRRAVSPLRKSPSQSGAAERA